MNDYIKRGDCLELMREIPDNGIDMILCDLPYGVTRNAWDKKISFDALWAEYRRIIKDDGAIVLFAQEPFTSELIQSNPKWFKYKWIWAKHSIVNFLNAKKQPLRNFEEIVVFYYKQCTYQPIMTKGKMQLKCRQGKQSANYGAYGRKPVINDVYYPRTIIDIPAQVARGGHPTQKPVALLEYLIKTYTHEGEIVLDNCMGSGSTCIACINTSRHYIGYELDETYFDIAAKRIDEAKQARQ